MSSCIALVDCEVVYRNDITPPHEVVKLTIRIDCAGTWDLPLDFMTFYAPGSSMQSMTVLDLDNVFPLVVTPFNVGLTTCIYWDSLVDGVDPNIACGYGMCVGVAATVETGNEPPPPDPPPPPGGSIPPPGGSIPPPEPPPTSPPGDEGPVIEDPGGAQPPGQEPPVSDSGGTPPPGTAPPGTPDPGGQSEITGGTPTPPAGVDTGNEGGGVITEIPSSTIVIPFPQEPILRVRPVDNPVVPQDGVINSPAWIRPADKSSADIPVPPITEPRSVPPGTIHRPNQPPGFRKGGGVNTPGPGQVTLLPGEISGNDTGINTGIYWSPGPEGHIPVSAYTVPVEYSDYPNVGDVISDNSTRPNPSADITAREIGGSTDRTDPSVYKYQDPTAGTRQQPVPWIPSDNAIPVDTQGNALIPGATSTDGAVTGARTANFKLFTTPELNLNGLDKTNLALGEGRPRSFVETEQDGEGAPPIVLQLDPFSVGGRQPRGIQGRGVHYGVRQLRTTSDNIVAAALANNNRMGLTRLETAVYPNNLIRTDRVHTMTVNVRNRSCHTNLESMLLTAGIIDADLNYVQLASKPVHIRPRKDTAISISIPKNCPPGPVQLVGILFGPDGEPVMTVTEPGYMMPDTNISQTYKPGDKLPATVKEILGITDARNSIHEGRAFPYKSPQHAKDFIATGDTIAGAVKISQAGADRGFNTQVAVTVDPLNTPTEYVFTDRVKIGQTDIFKGSHDTAFKLGNVTPGTRIRICVENQEIETDPRYSWSLFGAGLTEITGLGFDVTGDGFHINGDIDTPIVNGEVLIRNQRTNSEVLLHTDISGQVIIPLDSGNSGDTTLEFDATPGDLLYVLHPGNDGNFNIATNLVNSGSVLPDTGDILPDTGSPPIIIDPPLPSPIEPPVIGTDIIPRDEPITGVGLPGDGLPAAPDTDTDTSDDPPPYVPGPPPPPPPPSSPPEDDPPAPPPTVEIAWVDPQLVQIWTVLCGTICQRPENPCIVDVTVNINASGTFVLVPELCMYSIDTTTCFDGNWHKLEPILNDSAFSGLEPFVVNTDYSYNFVADMCDHISSFFSEEKIWFRLTFATLSCDLNPYGIGG